MYLLLHESPVIDGQRTNSMCTAVTAAVAVAEIARITGWSPVPEHRWFQMKMAIARLGKGRSWSRPAVLLTPPTWITTVTSTGFCPDVNAHLLHAKLEFRVLQILLVLFAQRDYNNKQSVDVHRERPTPTRSSLFLLVRVVGLWREINFRKKGIFRREF